MKLLDITPLSMGIVSGKMWTMDNDTITIQGYNRAWGGNNIFGMIFLIPDKHYYIRKLDAFYNCSLSVLLRNHVRDLNHRTKMNVTPISPDSLEDLASHKYILRDEITCWGWMGNLSHPMVLNRIRYDRNRIRPGANVEAIKKAFQLLK
jgi:hypothetical protein